MEITMEYAVNLLAQAEQVREQYEEVEMYGKSIKKPHLDKMVSLREEMQKCVHLESSSAFADKFSFYYRYIADTLFVEGLINQNEHKE